VALERPIFITDYKRKTLKTTQMLQIARKGAVTTNHVQHGRANTVYMDNLIFLWEME
jgi:hypothetical protein